MSLINSFFIRSILLTSLFTVMVNANAVPVKFCFENNGTPTYPQFNINGKLYYSNFFNSIRCFDLGDVTGNVIFNTSGFNVDYRNNIVSLGANMCGSATGPCVIPVEYQNQQLYYIEATVWALDKTTSTGVLSAIYKPKA